MSNGTITSTAKKAKKPTAALATEVQHPRVLQLHPDQIEWHPENPRQDFDREELQQLAETMQRVEQLQPIVVRPHPTKDGYYQGLAGERRWRAAKLVGMFVTAAIRDVDDAEALDIVVTENFARKDLNAIEQARAIRSLQASGLTQKQIGARYGKTQSWAANLLRLLDLPEAVQAKVIDGKLDQAKARELASLKDAPKTLALIVEDIEADQFGDWDVPRDDFSRQVENVADDLTRPMDPDGEKVYSRKWSRSTAIAFTPSAEELEQLGVEELTFNGKRERRATNVELWEQLQDAALENGGTTKGTKTTKKKPTAAELRKKQAEADKQLAERIQFWRRRWVRFVLATQYCDVERQQKLDFWQMKALLFLAAEHSGRYFQDALEDGLARIGKPFPKGWADPWELVAHAGDDLTRLMLAALRSALWPDGDRGEALQELKGLNDIGFEEVEHMAKDAGVDFERQWQILQGEWTKDFEEERADRLREFLELHTKDQLERQIEEWGGFEKLCGERLARPKNKAGLVEAMLDSDCDLVDLPQRVIDANPLKPVVKPSRKKK